MTEREYVETMRKAAADYVETISSRSGNQFSDTERWMRWKGIRDGMSAHTFIELCDAWLEKEASNGL